MTAPAYGFPPSSFDPSVLPDNERQFMDDEDIEAFAMALNDPESAPVIALNDWRPVNQRVRRRGPRSRRKKATARSKDETREGFVYTILKWPLLLIVVGWIIALGLCYIVTRLYIWGYECSVTWRGRREELRQNIRSTTTYDEWKAAAKELDRHLGNDTWKETESYAYYDHSTVAKVTQQLKTVRALAVSEGQNHESSARGPVITLKNLVEGCVKNNFVGVENPRLYSETYYGTKDLAQEFVDELHSSLAFLLHSPQLSQPEKYAFAKHLHTNFGRTALCLSGGASFAWYHLGVAKALLDASLLPDVITGTSGGALVAALIATRTDDELKKLLVPALAYHITACEDSFLTWFPRWWRTGARFDSLTWARKSSWFCRGSMTFREAYERTGRILNVSCVPSDPHSPTILSNYLTAPDCVIWSAVLASAAVPGILNPIVMMMKKPDGQLAPYSFGGTYKDGSLRTDVPLKALNLHFKVTFSIVSQVNPHINAFFYASKGSVGRPVTHRKGRGWRGGFLGSAMETYLKLELQKFLKMLRHLELLPRFLGQDWSSLWLQQFSGTITIWPKIYLSDFWFILSDPTPERLARMLFAGQLSAFPKILFIANRMKMERLIEEGLSLGGKGDPDGPDRLDHSGPQMYGQAIRSSEEPTTETDDDHQLQSSSGERGRSNVLAELRRQSGVFFDTLGPEGPEGESAESEEDIQPRRLAPYMMTAIEK